MHEISLMRDLFNRIESIAKNENAISVSKVHVKIGALSHISASHFKEHFDEFRVSTIAKDAELVITVDDNLNDPKAQDITLISIDVAE